MDTNSSYWFHYIVIQVQQTLRNSLLDMELIHKQEELERLELEQAIAMSLAVEHDRIKQMRLEMDILRNTEESTEDKQVFV